MLRSGSSIDLPAKIWFISQSTLPPGSLAIQVNESSKVIKRHKQRFAMSKEGAKTPHGPALLPVIRLSAARGASARPRGHHAGPPQPRRHCALSSIAKPTPRSPTCGCSTGPRALRPPAAPPRPEPSAEGERTQRAAAQSTGAFPARHKIASRAAHKKGSSLPLQTSATPTALAAAKLVVKLCAMSGWLTSFCRTTAQQNKGPEVAVALKGKQRSAAPSAS